MNPTKYKNKLSDAGLKVTPQRMAVLEAVVSIKNHPSADLIYDYVYLKYPNISLATIYKILDNLVEKGLIKRVKTEKDIMRYDADAKDHHHLYCSDSDSIVDYPDDHLTRKLHKHFKKHEIPGFTIEDMKLQIIGRFEQGKKK